MPKYEIDTEEARFFKAKYIVRAMDREDAKRAIRSGDAKKVFETFLDSKLEYTGIKELDEQVPAENEDDPFIAWQNEVDKEIRTLAEGLGVSVTCAGNIWYLRTRSRWSQEAEDELIRMDKAGEPAPNINEWP